MAVAAIETFTSMAAPVQFAAIEAFQPSFKIEDYLDRAARILKAFGQACNAVLNETGTENKILEGGFYLFPDLSQFYPQTGCKVYKRECSIRRSFIGTSRCSAVAGYRIWPPRF